MTLRTHHRIMWGLIGAGLVMPALAVSTIKIPTPESGTVFPAVFSMAEQTLVTVAAFVLKPLYQIISLIVVIMLWKRTDPDLAAVRRAMLAFLIGENACALNYLVFNERSLLMEFLHTYGMALCFGLVVYAMLEAFDKRVFHFSERNSKCALLPLCTRCYKYSSSSCNLRLLFLLVIPATAVLAAMPLAADLGNHFFSGAVFGGTVIFGQPLAYQIMEARFYPVASLIPFIVSFILLFFYRETLFEPSKMFYAMGTGPLGFSLMRFFLYWGYREKPLWADAWEEITEFLFIALIFWIVLRIRAVSRLSTSPLSRVGKRSTHFV